MTTGPGDRTGYSVECFGCGDWLPIKLSKKGLAYWICNQCVVQVFLRKIRREDLEEKDFEFSIRKEEP